jgi:hypothetical protein
MCGAITPLPLCFYGVWEEKMFCTAVVLVTVFIVANEIWLFK